MRSLTKLEINSGHIVINGRHARLINCGTRSLVRGVATGGNGGVRTPPLLFWRSFLILSKPGRNVCGGAR